jgi:hypothetical protein
MSEPNRLRVMADGVADKIAELQAERDAAPDREARKVANQRIHMLKGMEEWIRTRTGYR